MRNFLKQYFKSIPNNHDKTASNKQVTNEDKPKDVKLAINTAQFSSDIDFTDMTTILYHLMMNHHEMNYSNNLYELPSPITRRLDANDFEKLQTNYLTNNVMVMHRLTELIDFCDTPQDKWLVEQVKTIYVYDYLQQYVDRWYHNHQTNDTLAEQYQQLAQHGNYQAQISYLKDIKIVNDANDIVKNMDTTVKPYFRQLETQLLNSYDEKKWTLQLLNYDLIPQLNNFYLNHLQMSPVMLKTINSIDNMDTLINYFDIILNYYELNTDPNYPNHSKDFCQLVNASVSRSHQISTTHNPFDLFDWHISTNFSLIENEDTIMKQLRQLKVWQYHHQPTAH